MIISPPRFQGTLTPDILGMEYENISLLTDDLVTIEGWYIAQDVPRNTIILLHGFAVDKSDLIDVALLFYQNGYSVLLLDFRAHGKSGGNRCSLGFYETQELDAAVRFLKKRGSAGIGIMGFSMGGTVALLAASRNEDIDAIISDSAYLSFKTAVRDFASAYYRIPYFPFIPLIVWFAGKRLGFDPPDLDLSRHLPSIAPRPILIIHSIDDREITVSNAHLIYQYARPPKELWLVKEGGHLGACHTRRGAYEHRILSFFDRAFSPPPPDRPGAE